ncbi:MAG TPA: VOC family protein [Chloroflexota bacterium]|nr:VOC family protein [Chloroflexota bacterium]
MGDGSPRFQSAVLFVLDMVASRRFYEGLLGQTVIMDHGLNDGFSGGFAIWQADHASQTICTYPREDATPVGRNNVELYFEADDLDRMWSRLVEAGVSAVHPLWAQSWGQRVMWVAGPDNHIGELGEPIPVLIGRIAAQGMAPEAIVERTSMPVDIILQILGARGLPA